MEKPEITADSIMLEMTNDVRSGKVIEREKWLDYAFKLNLLQPFEVHEAEMARQDVAKLKWDILNKQVKKSVALAQAEIEADDTYRLAREQENKVERMEEFVRIAKKNSDSAF